MTRCFLAIYDYLVRHRLLAVFLLVAVVALNVVLSLRLHYKENIADFLPTNPENERYTSVYNGLGDQGQITVIFRLSDTNSDVDGKEQLELAVDDFEERSVAIPDSVAIQCRMDDSRLFETMDLLRDNFVLFLTPDDYARMDSLLAQPDYVAQCMHNIKGKLAYPMSALATEAIVNDPLNLYGPVLQGLSSLSASDQYQMDDGYLFDSDGRCAFAFMDSPYASSDTRNNARLQLHIQQILDSVMTANPNVSVSAVGAPLIAATNATQIKRDSFISIALAVVLILLILLFSIGHKRNLFWMGLSVAFGWLFALAAIALFRPSISIIVVGIGSVLMGIAVNYPLHFLDHIKHESNARNALKEMVEPLVVGNITTVSAFACLIFVNADAMRDLGLFGALMLVGTILFSMVFLPLFAKTGTRRTQHIETPASSAPSTPSAALRYIRPAVFLIVSALTIFFAVLSSHTSFDSDLHNINFMTPQQRDDLALLSQSVHNDDDLLYLVAEGDNLTDALSTNDSLLAQTLVADSNLRGVAHILPSLSRQQQALRLWNHFRSTHPDLEQEILYESQRSGFRPHAFDAFLQRWNAQYAPLSDTILRSLADLGSNYILHSDSSVRLVNFVKTPSSLAASQKEALRGSIAQHHLRAFVFDESDVGDNLVAMLSDNFNYILYVCGFVVFFFLLLSFGSVELALLSFLPLAVGWLWILGIMDLLSVQFNIVNIILATFIFGQGDDYTIFITEGLLYENAYGRKRLRTYRKSVILSALLMFVGIGTLIVARHPAMKSLAQVTIIGMATVVLMACYLPPLIFRWLTMRKSRGIFQPRRFPITILRLLRSFLALSVAALFMLLIFTPFTIFYWLILPDSEQKRLRYHAYIQKFTRKALLSIPAVSTTFHNLNNEDFSRPAIIIANHQSSLDLLCMLALTPKLVVLTNRRVWNNPLYSLIIRCAEFYPNNDGYDLTLARQRNLVSRGYSILVFPEGTRSLDGSIARFHKGAFQMAQDLHIDILPVFIHGVADIMPKNSLILSPGNIYVEVGQRISYLSFATLNARTLASQMRKYFLTHYDDICRQQQQMSYYLPLVRHQYIYKGHTIQRRCRKTLKHLDLAQLEQHLSENILVENDTRVCRYNDPGQGERSLLLALAHPDIVFYSSILNPDDLALASHCAAVPPNLHFLNPKNDLTE